MAKGMTKRDRAELKQKEITKSIKEARMQRGDKRRAEEASMTPEPVEKPISQARLKRLSLEYITPDKLTDLVRERCEYSKLHYKEGIRVSKEAFQYSDHFRSDYGLRLDFEDTCMTSQHHFGFELIEHHSRGSLVRIHYAVVDEGRPFFNKQKDIKPKLLSMRALVDIVGEYR